MHDKQVLSYLVGFLALLGAEPIEGGSEIRECGPQTVWIVAGVLPPSVKITHKEVKQLFNKYVGICQTHPDVIKMNPYSVEIFEHEDGRYIYVSVFN